MLAAWLLTLTLDTGRVFNYAAGRWTLGTSPGVEAACGPITLNFSGTWDRNGYVARDLSIAIDREVNARVTVTARGARYDYPGYDPDLTASVSVRWRIR